MKKYRRKKMIDQRMKGIAQSNSKELEFIEKDMQAISKELLKEVKEDDVEGAEKFAANIVLSSFYLHSYSLATLAFNAMMADKTKNPNTTRTIVDYFAVEAAKRMKL